MKAKLLIAQMAASVIGSMLITAPQASAVFIAPTDNAPFRRDQLPIDVETMKQLASQLTVLCGTVDASEPAAQRTAAQLLAIAQSLDPVNRQAQDLLENFIQEKTPAPPKSSDVQIAKSRAWRTQSWLGSDEAGKDGKNLALCLGDVLAKIDPDHPSAVAFKAEKGTWNEWVARVEEFNKKPEPAIADIDEEPEEKMEDTEKPEVPENEENKGSFALKTATVATPLMIYKEEDRSYDLRITPVTMTHWIDEEHDEFRYHLNDIDEERIRPALRSINKNTVPWLEQTFKRLPEGGVLVLSTPYKETYSVRRNDDNLSAAAAVLAAASLSGQEPTGVVIGIVQSDGKLKLPKNGWHMIRALAAAPPTRVVLPRSAAELLPSLLTLDELGFFMKHDIFLADNIDELVAFSKKTPDANIAAALSNFASIREKATSSLGPFVANQFVRSRLETIATATPQYASAQYLLMQARGKRPTYLSDKVVAHEARMALAPLNRIADFYEEEEGERKITSAMVQSAHESSRAVLDPLDRLISSSERALYGQAVDLSNTARTLARAIKKVADKNYEEGVKGFHDKSLSESSRSLRDGLPDIGRKIARILGEEEETKRKED